VGTGRTQCWEREFGVWEVDLVLGGDVARRIGSPNLASRGDEMVREIAKIYCKSVGMIIFWVFLYFTNGKRNEGSIGVALSCKVPFAFGKFCCLL
jgi:hypothetical protein